MRTGMATWRAVVGLTLLALLAGSAAARDTRNSYKGTSRMEMTSTQRALLEKLTADSRAHSKAAAAADVAGSSRTGPSRHLTGTSGLPEGIGMKMPEGFQVPTLPLFGSSDTPSIDVFSKPWAATMEELVEKRAGYVMEKHKVVTVDGYVLTMYRIPHGKYRNTAPGPRPVVMLQHGVTLSSNSFVVLNANESMAFILADAGFDVWMSNSRGNTYSRGHLFLNQWGQRYWRQSMDDLATIDLPAQIDYALKTTRASKLAYVGHSQGCTLIYMLLADKTSYNDKISVVVHIGPVAFPEYIRAPFLNAQPKIHSDAWLKDAPLGEFLANRDFAPFLMPFCQYNTTWNEFCVQHINGMFYGPSVYVPPQDYIIIFTTWPSSVATRNLEHWSQMFRDDKLKLKKYSYGSDCTNLLRGAALPRSFHESCNMAAYGTPEPEEYDLSRITAPQAYMLGSIDIMSTPEDVAEQQRQLSPNVTIHQYMYERYAHMDFVWDRNALYKADLVDLLYRYAPGTF